MAAAKERFRLASLLRLLAAVPEPSDPEPLGVTGEPDEVGDDLTRWLADREEREPHWPVGSGGAGTVAPDAAAREEAHPGR